MSRLLLRKLVAEKQKKVSGLHVEKGDRMSNASSERYRGTGGSASSGAPLFVKQTFQKQTTRFVSG